MKAFYRAFPVDIVLFVRLFAVNKEQDKERTVKPLENGYLLGLKGALMRAFIRSPKGLMKVIMLLWGVLHTPKNMRH